MSPLKARVSERLAQVEGVARLKVFKANENLHGAWPLGVGGVEQGPPFDRHKQQRMTVRCPVSSQDKEPLQGSHRESRAQRNVPSVN